MSQPNKPNGGPRRRYWCDLYKLPQKRISRLLTVETLDQLDRCKSAEAQRLLLGVSK